MMLWGFRRTGVTLWHRLSERKKQACYHFSNGASERQELQTDLTTTNNSREITLPEAQRTQGIESVT